MPRPLLEKILLATDGSPASRAAFAWANRLGTANKAFVEVLVVAAPNDHYAMYGPLAAQLYREERAQASKLMGDVVRRLRRARIEAAGSVAAGNPAKKIIERARTAGAQLVIVGSHGHGALGRLMLGSVADAVKDALACDVLIAKRAPRGRTVLVAQDGSSSSEALAAKGAAFAKLLRSDLRVLHVFPAPFVAPTARFARGLRRAAQEARAAGQARTAADHVVKASAGADLVVVGSRGLRGLERFSSGSVSHRVGHQAKTSVLVIRLGGRSRGRTRA